jgi:two-component system response regulator PilR (NtrC family)
MAGRVTLIVEDDRVTLKALQHLLRGIGHTVQTASSIGEANNLLGGCDNMILDLNLPDGLGTDILRRVIDELLPIRIAVISGTTNGRLYAEACKLRPSIMFRKPVDIDDLLAWLTTSELPSSP